MSGQEETWGGAVFGNAMAPKRNQPVAASGMAPGKRAEAICGPGLIVGIWAYMAVRIIVGGAGWKLDLDRLARTSLR